ncbi:hypothetical protein CCYA_CCYA03G0912 [Cyanidiococcus yangmingshanensis]|nr:hypothetical protein CCYA_CCYA03G0912 [Cyanidiococcus yangmingshanensis]
MRRLGGRVRGAERSRAVAWVTALPLLWCALPRLRLSIQLTRENARREQATRRVGRSLLRTRRVSADFVGVSAGTKREQRRRCVLFQTLGAKAEDTRSTSPSTDNESVSMGLDYLCIPAKPRSASMASFLVPFMATGLLDDDTLRHVVEVFVLLTLGSNSRTTVQQRSVETRARIAAALRGRKRPTEVRQRIAASLRGRSLSDTHRRRIREALSGEKNPMYGRRRSDEERARIREAVLRTLGQRRREPKTSQGSGSRIETSPRNSPASPSMPQDWRTNAMPMSQLVEMIWHYPGTTEMLLEEFKTGKSLKTSSSEDGQHITPENGTEHNIEGQTRCRDPVTDAAFIMKRIRVKPAQLRHSQGQSAPPSVGLTYINANNKYSRACPACNGRGLIPCPYCVERFGHCSRACAHCRGSGIGICDHCQGTRHEFDPDAKSYRI